MAPENVHVLPSNLEHVGWLMNRLNHLRAEMLKEMLAPIGLSARALAVLQAVRELPDPVAQQEVATALMLDHTSVATLAEQLQERELIRRERDPRNRRRYAVELTDAGVGVLAKTRQGIEAIEQQMRRGLDEDDVETLRILLLKVAREHGIR